MNYKLNLTLIRWSKKILKNWVGFSWFLSYFTCSFWGHHRLLSNKLIDVWIIYVIPWIFLRTFWTIVNLTLDGYLVPRTLKYCDRDHGTVSLFPSTSTCKSSLLCGDHLHPQGRTLHHHHSQCHEKQNMHIFWQGHHMAHLCTQTLFLCRILYRRWAFLSDGWKSFSQCWSEVACVHA